MVYVIVVFFIVLVIIAISAMMIAVKKNKNSLSTKEMVELEKMITKQMITKQMIIPENSNFKNDIKSRYDVFIDGKEIGNNFKKDDLLVILNSLVNDQEYERFDEIVFKKHE